MAKTNDSTPVATKALRQPWPLTSHPRMGGPTAEPSATPEMNTPPPRPRSSLGSQSDSVRTDAGMNGDSATPSSSRGPNSAPTELVRTVRKLAIPQSTMAPE